MRCCWQCSPRRCSPSQCRCRCLRRYRRWECSAGVATEDETAPQDEDAMVSVAARCAVENVDEALAIKPDARIHRGDAVADLGAVWSEKARGIAGGHAVLDAVSYTH